MNEIKIAELRKQAEALREQLKALQDAELESLRAFAQTLTTVPVFVRMWDSGWDFEVSMLDPKRATENSPPTSAFAGATPIPKRPANSRSTRAPVARLALTTRARFSSIK